MKLRTISIAASVGALAALSLAPAALAQAPARTAGSGVYTAPRTELGQPDLQGVWTNATITPLERDAKYGERQALTPQEAAQLERANAEQSAEGDKPTDPNAKVTDLPTNCGKGFTGVDCGYNSAWTDSGTQVIKLDGEYRASILISPKNGKFPPMTEAGRKAGAARLASYRRNNFDNPENRSLGERCILSFGSSAGPPMLPLLYNNTYQIVQTKDAVMIEVEMVHDTRIIRLNSQHLPQTVKLWMGDSIGHWEGDTLVVETTNMRPEQAFRGASPELKVTERFTRVGPGQIKYSFTVDDPKTYVSPYTGEVALNATKGPIYEYACHEGNYALPGILAGARAQEKEALAAARAAAGPAAPAPSGKTSTK